MTDTPEPQPHVPWPHRCVYFAYDVEGEPGLGTCQVNPPDVLGRYPVVHEDCNCRFYESCEGDDHTCRDCRYHDAGEGLCYGAPGQPQPAHEARRACAMFKEW